MAVVDKWRKIISDTDSLMKLGGNQRFWRVLAWLRLGEVPQAEKEWRAGETLFKNNPKNLTLLAEIELTRGREGESCAILERTYTSTAEDAQLKKSWLFLARRLKKPSPFVLKELNKNRVDKNQGMGSRENWKRFVDLQPSEKQAEAFVDWLKWEIGEGAESEQVVGEMIETCLTNTTLSKTALKELMELLIKSEMWSLFLEYLFKMMTPQAKDTLDFWESTHRRCSAKWRPHLREKMQGYLTTHPDYKLESYLESVSPKTESLS